MIEENLELADRETFPQELTRDGAGDALASDAAEDCSADGEGKAIGKGEEKGTSEGRLSPSSCVVGVIGWVGERLSWAGVEGPAWISSSALDRMPFSGC